MIIRAIFVLVLFLTAQVASADQFTWQTDKPESHGLSPQKLDDLRTTLAKNSTSGLLIIRHDKIVYEWYAPDAGPEKPHGTASLAKAIVGGMSLAVAVQDGRVKPDDPVSRFIAAWRDDPRKSKITFAELAMHTSGLDDAEEDHVAHDKLTGWKGEFWKREPTDPFTISRDTIPTLFDPGQRVSYSNPGMAMLSYAVTAAIQPGEQKDIRSLLRERIYKPIGITDKEWSVGYNKSYPVGGLQLVANWGGASFTARAAARIGRLMLREGDWDGHRILDAAVVRACIDPPGKSPPRETAVHSAPSPGFGWWLNRDLAWKSLPRDTYLGAGAGHQLLIVIPSLDMIVVRNGAGFSVDGDDGWPAVDRLLFTPLAAAVTDPPYPPSSVIRAVHFDEESKIIRKAPDSDNWPLTWADDDHLYTSYGDGHGFKPLIKPKLSMGFARVEGNPPDFQGINIRSETGERTGGGAKGAKASGILMVDGTLYMWVRNTANATLAWSTDHAVTWNWGFTLDTSFGCPAFLNFGRNYAGARDDYVYIYSQDGPGAYEPYDGVVMARVPRSKIRDRSAYEFCSATNPEKWSPDIAQRTHIFHYPGHCERLDVVFNPGIKRYLMTVSFGHGQGWGIFDAPEPWGPWSTAFTTRDWGQGETHGYRIPTKWISTDGKELYLVFSGRLINDAFCLRRFVLDLYGN